jgi:hypothetical protein
LKWIPYIAAGIICSLLSIVFLAFPRTKTETVVKKVSPYAGFHLVDAYQNDIRETDNGVLTVKCDTRENRAGTYKATTAEQIHPGDMVVTVCEAIVVKAEPAA